MPVLFWRHKQFDLCRHPSLLVQDNNFDCWCPRYLIRLDGGFHVWIVIFQVLVNVFDIIIGCFACFHRFSSTPLFYKVFPARSPAGFPAALKIRKETGGLSGSTWCASGCQCFRPGDNNWRSRWPHTLCFGICM